jgi:hypothetical protein
MTNAVFAALGRRTRTANRPASGLACLPQEGTLQVQWHDKSSRRAVSGATLATGAWVSFQQSIRDHGGKWHKTARSASGGGRIFRKPLFLWRSLRDSNPCYSLERAMSWASRRRERVTSGPDSGARYYRGQYRGDKRPLASRTQVRFRARARALRHRGRIRRRSIRGSLRDRRIPAPPAGSALPPAPARG